MNINRKPILIILLLLSVCPAVQFEGGVNYDLNKPKYMFSMDIYPWTFSETDDRRDHTWNGLGIFTSYYDNTFYISPMFGKAEYEPNKVMTIFIGPEIGINHPEKAGICLKGTTYIWRIIPFSLVIDPKYNFDTDELIWDFKCTIGIGVFRPLDKALGRTPPRARDD